MSTQPARGMRDFLPQDVRRREYVVGIISGVYDRYGFEPLETPAVENIETLLGGNYGEENSKLIFKILKRGEHEASGEADLALRYDLTVPLARVMAEYQSKLPRIFKRYQIQPVWRADRPARGRFREFFQCDIDSVGSLSPAVEAEQIAAVSEILTTLGFDDFVLRINHRKFISAWLNQIPVPADRHADVLITIDKVDKVGKEGVAKELTPKGFSDAQIDGISAGLATHHPPQWLDSLARAFPPDATTTAWKTCGRFCASRRTRARRQDPVRSLACARTGLLHGHDHGNQREGPARQHGRWRALRQPDWRCSSSPIFRPVASRWGSNAFSWSCRSAGCFRSRSSSPRSMSLSPRLTKKRTWRPWIPRPSCAAAAISASICIRMSRGKWTRCSSTLISAMRDSSPSSAATRLRKAR